MTLSDDVRIVEVGPRDGLQNEVKTLSTQKKVELITLLLAAGIETIEAGSFVSPQRIPQLSDTAEVLKQLNEKGVKGRFPVLIPNLQGLKNALRVPVKEIAVFIAASETFSQKNIQCSIAESLERIEQLLPLVAEHGLVMRGYISCTLGCPFEGKVPISMVVKLSHALLKLGCKEISLGDTIGVGTVRSSTQLIKTLSKEIPVETFAVHFHDTYGQALANIYACLSLGIKTIDSAISGLGGCPYAPGASGNVATEDVVYLLHGLGLAKKIDLQKVVQASHFVNQALHMKPRSRVAQAMLSKKF
jgi:isopropylmalate/homocitrate/citramalate synthase